MVNKAPETLTQELVTLIARHGDGHPRVAHLRWLLASHRRAKPRNDAAPVPAAAPDHGDGRSGSGAVSRPPGD